MAAARTEPDAESARTVDSAAAAPVALAPGSEAAPAARAATALTPGPMTAARVAALQRTAGNAAVAQMLARRRTASQPTISRLATSGPGPSAGPSAPTPAAAPGASAVTTGSAPSAGGAGAGSASPAAAAAPGSASSVAAAVPGAAGPAPAAAHAVASPAPPAGGAASQNPAAKGAAAPVAGPAQPGAAAPVALAGPAVKKDPHADPNFNAMKGKAETAGGGAKAHAPAKEGADAAQAAAVGPSNDVSSQAAAAQVDEMSTKQPGAFDRAAFIKAVREAIDASTPKNLEEVDDFKEKGGAGKVKGQVSGLVKDGKQESEKDIKDATEASPDASKGKAKLVKPMAHEPVGEKTGSVGASAAMPPPAPAAATDLSSGPESVEAKMAEASVTDEQLQKSNEPDFKAALGARDAAKEHSADAPKAFRKSEKDVLGKAKGDAAAAEGLGLQGMHGVRGKAFSQALSQKQGAKSEDEAKRAKVASDIQGIYERTKSDVQKRLDGLDSKVDATFSQGEGAARKRFEDHVGARMDAYKAQRYGGFGGGALWLKDKLLGMPSDVNRFYDEGKARYLKEMDVVIGKVADVVGAGLTAARARITQGQAQIKKYVAQLPQDLQKVGQEAEEKLAGEFEQLTADVDSKQSELVDTLAKKYVESRDAVDARIDEMKAANRGLVAKAMDAVGGVVKTILQLKDMLMGVLAKAADVIGDIIADPIGFLGKLVDGVKGGLQRFVGNIATHLQKGLMGWLFGALGGGGLQLPKSFDLKGILDLILQVLGLTYRNIRARVARLVGEPMVARLESTVEVFKTLVTEGPGGLWKWIMEKVGDLEELVLGPIKDFIIEKVIKAGITWLIAFLNPAAAFIKACKAIYDIVMFLVERGSQIMEFVNSILDSVGAIAKGNIGIVTEKIESSLSRALPLAISFLASVLGLGGISDKIRSVIQKVQAPITKAVDFVVMGAVKGAKKLFGGAASWMKGKYDKGKQWVKDKATSVKDWGKDKAAGLLEWWKIKQPFTSTDGEAHTLFFKGSGPRAQLTVASTPMPVRDFLAKVAAKLATTEGKTLGPAHASAVAQVGVVDAAQSKVETSQRDPADVDALNQAMRVLAGLLKPLVPLVEAPRQAGTLSVGVGDLVRTPDGIGTITKIDDRVHLSYVGDDSGLTTSTEVADFVKRFDAGRITKFTKKSRRILFMGSTPNKTSPIGRQVLERMRREGKYRPETQEVSYRRDANGNPTSTERWVKVAECDMGHIVDAVVWWNANGRFTGARSTEVKKFMHEPNNYEFEPSDENQARGRALDDQYLPPVV